MNYRSGFVVVVLPRVLIAALAVTLFHSASFAAGKKPAPTKPAAEKTLAGPVIPFTVERAGIVSINLYQSDGRLVRRLIESKRYAAGPQKVAWDGRSDDGDPVPPGDYTWKGLFHEGIDLKLRGWAANGGGTSLWPIADGKEDWGGDGGVPSAVAADDERVYLGWSLARQGRAILACDVDGRIQWGHRRGEGPCGCKALCVDDGMLYVLGGREGVDAEGGAIYRLRVKDGKPVPWPDGKLDLKISQLWPEDAKAKPEIADALAVRHGHMYLSFTSSEFMAVLDAKTGAYLQTVVGAPPGQVDVVATKSDLPDAPNKIVDADFLVIALGGGVLGKVLMVHDPLWVLTSEMSAVGNGARISALSILGDTAKFSRHMAFVGLDTPVHQVQARHLLDMDTVRWVAGQPGGRPLQGPWQPEGLRAVRGLALDGKGKLWIAEGDGFPKRFSVWDTNGERGKLVREFIGPKDLQSGYGAINPLDPNLMYAAGCEWRIDPKTGMAACLGVVTREGMTDGRFGVGENGNVYLVTQHGARVRIFERAGDGDYKLRAAFYPADAAGMESDMATAAQTIAWADENGDGEPQPAEQHSVARPLEFVAMGSLTDLALYAQSRGQPPGSRQGNLFKVAGWSPCGAPRYDLQSPVTWPDGGQVSADGQLVVGLETSDKSSRWVCRGLADHRERWSRSGLAGVSLFSGVARMPEPLGNLWLTSCGNFSEPVTAQTAVSRPDLVDDFFLYPSPGGGTAAWILMNDDGFELVQFFPGDLKEARWPKAVAPGVSMMKAWNRRYGSLTQAVDGKLYLQAGDSAAWNLEITGLDKVQALPGGTISMPPR